MLKSPGALTPANLIFLLLTFQLTARDIHCPWVVSVGKLCCSLMATSFPVWRQLSSLAGGLRVKKSPKDATKSGSLPELGETQKCTAGLLKTEQ